MAVADAPPSQQSLSLWTRLRSAQADLVGRRAERTEDEEQGVPVVRVDRITRLIGPRTSQDEAETASACERAARADGEECCVVLDLTAERSLDRETARRLTRLSARLAERGGGVAVVARSPAVLGALAEAADGVVVPTFPTRAEALAGVPGRLTARASSGVLAHRGKGAPSPAIEARTPA